MSVVIDKLSEESGKCIGCGFCESVCPTQPASGYSESRGARGRVLLARELLARTREGRDLSTLTDSFYSCLDCYACFEVCPAGVNAGVVSHYAKEILAPSSAPRNAKLIESIVMRYGSLVPARRAMSRWAKGLSIPRMGETVLYTGQMYQTMAYSGRLGYMLNRRVAGRDFAAALVAHFPSLSRSASLFRNRRLAAEMNGHLRDIAALLKLAGVEFSYLHEEEMYPGTLLNDMGFSDSFAKYAARLSDSFRKSGARKIITVDPHTYDLLKNTVPSVLPDFDFEVVHYLELIGNIRLKQTGRKIVFHEPCHLSRRFSSFTAPNDLVGRACDVSLPSRNGRRTHCCGGPDELLFPSTASAVSRRRTEQLAETGADIVVTACPVCRVNIRTGGEVTDIASVLRESASAALLPTV